MPEVTGRGFPYPLGTEPARDGNDAIQALAETLDSDVGKIASGSATVTTNSSSPSTGSTAIVFPPGRFSTVPTILLTQISGIPSNASEFTNPWASAITPAGFTINIRRSGAGTFTVMWAALGADR